MSPSEWFAPMHIFKNGYLCLPFLSLPYIDILSDKRHNGFVVGASNVLFQQKRHLVDILIHVQTQQIDLIDVELKKCLQLTTEDLRFFEHILKGIESPKVDEEQIIGSDHWIRKQFESYFTSMLRTAYGKSIFIFIFIFISLFCTSI
jgi:Transport protein Avl9